MIGRPTLVATMLAVIGAATLLLAGPALPPSTYGPAALGAASVLLATARLLREIRRRDRLSISIGAGVLGFLAGAAAARGPHAWALGFAAAWAPALALFLAGVGRERLAFELERLEDEADDPALRPGALRRAAAIRDQARAAARGVDPGAAHGPSHPGDARAIYAYAAQVTAYAHGLDERFEDAVAALSEVPPAWMPAPMRPLILSNLSHWQLCAGDLPGAQRTIAAIEEDGILPAVRPVVRGARAAVLVRAGETEAALDLIGRKDGELGEPPLVQQRYRVTRAHALAAKGHAEAAREELRRVVADVGVGELERWLPAGGPALKAMQALIDAG